MSEANEAELQPAIYIAHWPGKDTPVCEDHLQKLVGLSAVLGLSLSWTPCESTVCTNCERESSRKRADQR